MTDTRNPYYVPASADEHVARWIRWAEEHSFLDVDAQQQGILIDSVMIDGVVPEAFATAIDFIDARDQLGQLDQWDRQS